MTGQGKKKAREAPAKKWDLGNHTSSGSLTYLAGNLNNRTAARNDHTARLGTEPTLNRSALKPLALGPGHSKLVVEFPTIDSATLAGGSMVAALHTFGISLVAPLGLRGLERRFAVGFLTNVQRVLEGRGVGEDSAIFPGIEKWRNRSREV